MRLNKDTILQHSIWKDKNIEIPMYNIEEMVCKTRDNPTWIHFGAGNIFKAFIAPLQNTLLNLNK
ncbi:MAG: mannitol dehydrogenase family protein, partial [Bacillota bacterium]|nr:mannitol dehydrogenase family protein [Bacillota bacterium]